MPSEEDVKFGDGAIEGRTAGVPSSYDEGGSTRWTPDAIAEVHALGAARPLSGARLQHLQQAHADLRRPDLRAGDHDPPAAGGLPRELRNQDRPGCGTRPGREAARTENPDLYRLHVLRRPVRERQGQPRLRCLQGRHDDLHRRGRHARRRARSVTDAALPNVAGALSHRPRPFATRGCAGNRGRPGRETRHRRALAGHEGLRARLEDAHPAAGRRPALHHPPSRISWGPTTCRSKSRNSGSPPTTRCRFS